MPAANLNPEDQAELLAVIRLLDDAQTRCRRLVARLAAGAAPAPGVGAGAGAAAPAGPPAAAPAPVAPAPAAPAAPAPAPVAPAPAAPPATVAPGGGLREALLAVLTAAGEPVEFEELFARVQATGIALPADRPKLALRKALYAAADAVVAVKGGAFALKAERVP